MVVHGFRGARRRNCDLQNTHKLILKNHFVALWSCLHGVVAVRKVRFVLSVGVKTQALNGTIAMVKKASLLLRGRRLGKFMERSIYKTSVAGVPPGAPFHSVD